MVATFVTTLDNPFDYFTQFEDWNKFDEDKGYYTCNYVARIAKTSTEMSERDYVQAVNDAVDEILRLNVTGNYVKAIDSKNRIEDLDESNEESDEFVEIEE